LLALLLEAQQSGVQISDELIRDEATTFLLGGHETTAIALAWVWHLLAQHPDVEERLAKHLEVELCGRPPRFEDLPRLAYLQQVLRESLRLYPPAWYMTRRADRDVEIGGYRVPKGVNVVMDIWAVHAATTLRPGEGGVRVKVRARASRQGSTVPSRRKSGSYRAFVAA